MWIEIEMKAGISVIRTESVDRDREENRYFCNKDRECG